MLIRHFAIGEKEQQSGEQAHFLDTRCSAPVPYTESHEIYRQRYLEKCIAATCRNGDCLNADLPRTYIAYHLNGRTINIDGKLDDPAWVDVPWTDSFTDIRGPSFPAPYFDTKVKVRWDNERLYVGARMQETDFWGTYRQDEDPVWRENAFEVYAVPDGSLHNYKEMQISVRNVSWDLMLRKAYMDNPCKNDSAVSVWDSQMVKATYTDGGINDPTKKGTFWSAEMSFSFAALAENTTRTMPTPANGEAWFFIFARPEYKFKIVNGQYVKDPDAPTEWWSWANMGAVNLHLPSRFGLVQFLRNRGANDEFFYDRWHIYRALFDVFEAEHRFKAVNGMFIGDINLLDVPPKTLASDCVTAKVTSDGADFDVEVKSLARPSLPTGHIRADRYVWFM
ncbi:hypothetical protein DPMN_071560 [Dreissena polymorpha]|uniref:Carbohydrate-binding domain-containing protein n=1 Tax=Dreissena polymorpha TaxID=45954 RepID=A0A9D3Z800_DREPO|nr:hypothetical protein DPMN_071560 [Dreissena polymorpha]